MTDRLDSQTTSQILLQDLRRIIEARQGVTSTFNNALTMLCRYLGNRIKQEILKGERLGNKPSRNNGTVFKSL